MPAVDAKHTEINLKLKLFFDKIILLTVAELGNRKTDWEMLGIAAFIIVYKVYIPRWPGHQVHTRAQLKSDFPNENTFFESQLVIIKIIYFY